MIKANELRIGNWVSIGNRPIKVKNIDDTGINVEIGGGYYPGECEKEYYGEFSNSSNHAFFSLFGSERAVNAIALTPEILEKAGFVIVNHIHGYSFYTSNRKKHKSMPPIDIYDSHTDFYGYRVRHCAYVHQLQNLYFALTGNELEINL